MKKNIQVFLTGDSTCEIDGQLHHIEYGKEMVWVIIRENDKLWEHVLPISQIRMIRISRP